MSKTGKIVKLNLGKGRFLDCDITVPLEQYMSDNFQLHEMVDPTNNELIYCPMLNIVMQEARDISKCTIIVKDGLSWQRFKNYNDAVGGSPTSLHLTGAATDSKWYRNIGRKQVQVHPIHCAYILQEIAMRFRLKYELGVYLPGYDGESTGYVHFGIMESGNHLYYYDKSGKKYEIKSLKEIDLGC